MPGTSVRPRRHTLALVGAVLDDPAAARRGLLRLIDESGEDYLYPTRMFAPVQLPAAVRRRFSATPKSAN